MRLRFSPNVLGGGSLASQDQSAVGAKSSSGHQQEIEVEVSSLGTDFPVDLPIRLLKIDVEGFEIEVLQGASRLLENHCIDILMLECLQEVFGDAWSEFASELDKLIAMGYDPYTLTWSSKLRKLTLKQVLYSDRGRNVIFVSKHAKSTIRELS